MPWWPLWGGQRARSRARDTDVLTTASLAELIGSSVATSHGTAGPGVDPVARLDVPHQRTPDTSARPVTMRRICDALDRLEIRYLTDNDGSLLAMWERHAVLFALEGPDDEILVMRGRPHGTVSPDWADRAYRVVNEWNHTRRFCKAYVGDATERGMLPIYAEIQVPLLAGVHDALLDEMLDCAAAVTSAFVDWLYDDGGLL
jgi:Putative bacterial sensory transduction regulator